MTKVSPEFVDEPQMQKVQSVSTDVCLSNNQFPKYKLGPNFEVLQETKEDNKGPPLKEVVEEETTRLTEQHNRLSVRDLASKFDKNLAAAAKLSDEAKIREAPSLEGHVLLKKLRDSLEFLKGRLAGLNKEDIEIAISLRSSSHSFWRLVYGSRSVFLHITDTARGKQVLYLLANVLPCFVHVNRHMEQIELALSKSTVDESEISPNDAVGKVLGKEHPGRVRCMGLGAAPSNTFGQTNLRRGGIRLSSSNDARCSSGCQVKYETLFDTLKAYMIMKEGRIPEQFAEIFGSAPSMPSDSSSEQVSPMNVGGSTGDENH